MTTEFDPKTHTYKIDGKPATGVTTIISVLAKPALINWAARMACESVKERLDTSDRVIRPIEGEQFYYKVSVPVLESILEEARTAHTKKKEAAGTHGTDSHALVEAYVNDCLAVEGKPLVGSPAYTDAIRPFITWAEENVDHFLYSERQMFNKDLFIAGTADFGCVLKTGQKLIGDFKTSSGIYGIDYYLQCAGYKILAEGEGDEPYDGCVIVRLGKKGPKDFDVTYNYDTTTAEKSFMACLTLYRAQAALRQTAIRE